MYYHLINLTSFGQFCLLCHSRCFPKVHFIVYAGHALPFIDICCLPYHRYESIVHVKLSIYLGIIIYFVWYSFLSIDTPPYTWKLQNIGYGACHYGDVLIGAMASQMTRLTIVYSIFFPGADQRKHQCSTSLAFVRGIHRWSVNSPHKGLLTRKMFPFDDVIMVRSIKSHYQAVALGGLIYLPQSWAIILTALGQTWATIQKIFRNKLTLRLQGRIAIKQDIFL